MSNAKMPKGIPYIIGNEFAERFSYYGMKAILVVFMTKYLVDSSGEAAVMGDTEAKFWYHLFGTANYFFPVLGALLADIFLGKYRTIIWLSIVYCLGHLALALDETRVGLTIGLTLIAMGSGGIKPCVSAHVGDQFGEENKSLLDHIFGYFYIAINVGALISTLLTPILLDKYGPSVAFGIPGLLMLIATIIFYMGRKEFISVKPVGLKKYMADLTSPAGVKALLNLTPIYILVAIFFSLFEQTGSSWVLQAQLMDRNINLGLFSFELLPSQIQASNSFMIIFLIPIFSYIIYPTLQKFLPLNGLRKIGIGMLLSGAAFGVCALAEAQIQAGGTPTIAYQFFAFLLISAAEVMVSVVALEFAYTQAPKSLKSFFMSFYLLSISLGNLIAALVNLIIQNADGTSKLPGATYYLFFVGLTFVAGVALLVYSKYYQEERYVQTSDMIEEVD